MIFPPSNVGQIDDTDVFGTFTPDEARCMGVTAVHSDENAPAAGSNEKVGVVSLEFDEIPGVTKKDV